MKIRIRHPFLLFVLIASLGLIPAGRVTAQTFTTLYSFTATTGSWPHTNTDGAGPMAGLILSGNTLYGTADGGGSSGQGTVFAVNTDGTGFRTLHSSTGNDGGNARAGLILSGNTLYGTTFSGGSADNGTVFKVNTNGTGFMTLHSFTGKSDGSQPSAALMLSGNTLYGTAVSGGSSLGGTVFKVNTDGTGFTILYSFTARDPYTDINSDGGFPYGGLILSGNTLYGTAYLGGSSGWGTVFKLNTDGTGFTTLYSFTDGSDGAGPAAGLILSTNTLYGTTYGENPNGGNSTVFAVNTDGTGFTTLYGFTGGSDGAHAWAGLILSGNTLYGTANRGGSSDNGTVFAVNTDGTGFTNLYSFTAAAGYSPNGWPINTDGAFPYAGLILSGNTLYGTAESGGSSAVGTVFSITLPGPPQLTIIPSGANVILTWPTNAAGFTLQSTTNLGSSAVWTTNSPAPVVVNGQNTVTNPISGAQQFYRLSQ